MSWIVVPNWPKFQHYSDDRALVWIKLYLELRSRDDWRQLSLAARGLLVSIWIEYAASDGQIRTSDLQHRVNHRIPKGSWDSLLQAGFLRLRASKPLALARARARRREAEKEKETPKPPSTKKTNSRVTGWRLVKGSHGVTHVPDPFGTDRPPTGQAAR